MTEQEIIDLVLIADGYTLELTTTLLKNNKLGCIDTETSSHINQLTILKSQLRYKVIHNDYGKETQWLYSCLLSSVSLYSGSSISVDPNSKTIGVSIILPTDIAPPWLDFYWGEMEAADQDINGARYTYIHPDWNNWNPSLQTGTTLLYLGIDYDMYQGGIVVLRQGKGIYDGQSIRADSFSHYVAPTA